MNKEQVLENLRNCVEKDLKIKIKDNNQDLIGQKVIDSFCMLLLITFIKSKFGVQLDTKKLDFDAFTSLNTLADIILKEMKAGSPA